MMSAEEVIKLSRRDFLRISTVAGTGLLASIYLSACQDEVPVAPSPTVPSPVAAETEEPMTNFELQPNVFVKLETNGKVTITVAKPDIGQGMRTALPMIVAEELEVEWENIEVEQASASSNYFNQYVGGSNSIAKMYRPMRRAGAAVRGLLIAAAAQIWNVDPESCYARNGAIIHEPSGDQLLYGDLLTTAAEIPLTNSDPKDDTEFQLIGTPAARKDLPKIVDGSATYTSDLVIPGMLYAVVARPPQGTNQIESYDDSKALALPGVHHVLQFGNKIAVAADATWQALKGRDALTINWQEGNTDTFSAPRDQAGTEIDGTTLKSSYVIPHFAHVTMEPMTCVADVQENAAIVWAPTQSPMDTKTRVASLLEKTPAAENVEIQVPLIGGGFGRRLEMDFVEEAVQISQAIKKPVKVFWTREDDIRNDYLHPAATVSLEATLDNPTKPNMRRIYHKSSAKTGFWRSVHHNDIAFAWESFLDEYAEALGMDPVTLRRQIYSEPLLVNVMEKAVEASNWGSPLPEGKALGLACFSTWDATHVAEVAEVSVADNGRIRVHKVICAVDCGMVINPNIIREQMEGGIAFALSALLGNEVTLRDGQIEQSNFDDFPILRIDEMPEVEVHILPKSRDPKGIGEMAGPPLLAAVANAVYALTGKRLRQLPLRLNDS